jgi:hypothetical protein
MRGAFLVLAKHLENIVVRDQVVGHPDRQRLRVGLRIVESHLDIFAQEVAMSKFGSLFAVCSCAFLVHAADTPQERLKDANQVFSEIMATPDVRRNNI